MKGKHLSLKQRLLVAATLFGMFFGAGNLIFPVHLGQLAGHNLVPATVGFILTAVGIPILGVAAIGNTHSDGLQALASKVGGRYGCFFTCLLYLTIGPCFAIPRCATTSFTTGTVNNMHDTLTPLGGMIPLLHMMLNVVFGGKGVGLMNMIMYAILAVFICGLMIGRTPEYLGKKIEGREMKLTALCIIIHPFLILFFSALAVSTSGGLEGITNPGFHGLSQVLYEYASSAANNGSGFEGLADNSYFWNITAGLAMFFGRYLSIVIQLAIAGSLMRKRFVNETVGTLRTDTLSFAVILVFVVYIFAALTFFPALALGPIAEHLTLWA